MACETYKDLIDKYIEGMATLDEKKALEEHMEKCANCKREAEELRQIVKAFNSFEEVDLPADFMPSLHEKLIKMESAQPPAVSSNFDSIIRCIFTSLLNFYRQNKKSLAMAFGMLVIGIFLTQILSGLPWTNLKTRDGEARQQQTVKPEAFRSAAVSDAAPAKSETEKSVSEAAKPVEESKMVAEAAPVQEKVLDVNSSSSKSATKYPAARNGQVRLLKTVNNLHTATESGEVQKVKTITLSVYVRDLDEKMADIGPLVENLGGFIEQSNMAAGESREFHRTASIAIRVPEAGFTKAVEEIKALGELQNESTTDNDMDENYRDAGARGQNLGQNEAGDALIDSDNGEYTGDGSTRMKTEAGKPVGQSVTKDEAKQMSIIQVILIEQKPSPENEVPKQ